MPRNGQYTQADLVLIEPRLGWPAGWGTPRLKRNHDAMVAIMRRYGYTTTVNEIYRDLAKQLYYRNEYLAGRGAPAAIVGTSKHGTGEAEDWDAPMNSWTSPMQSIWAANEAACGYSSAQGRADGEPWHKVSVGEPSAAVAGGGAIPISNTTKEDEMKLWWTTEGTGWLDLDAGSVGLPSMPIYTLFKRVINSNQAADRPDTFNRAERDMMHALKVGLYQGVVGGPTLPFTLDTTKLANAVATALAAQGVKTNIDWTDAKFVKALDDGFVRSMAAYAKAAKDGIGFDSVKLANSVAESLQKTGVVVTPDTAAVQGAVLAAINRANAAIGKTLQNPVQ